MLTLHNSYPNMKKARAILIGIALILLIYALISEIILSNHQYSLYVYVDGTHVRTLTVDRKEVYCETPVTLDDGTVTSVPTYYYNPSTNILSFTKAYREDTGYNYTWLTTDENLPNLIRPYKSDIRLSKWKTAKPNTIDSVTSSTRGILSNLALNDIFLMSSINNSLYQLQRDNSNGKSTEYDSQAKEFSELTTQLDRFGDISGSANLFTYLTELSQEQLNSLHLTNTYSYLIRQIGKEDNDLLTVSLIVGGGGTEPHNIVLRYREMETPSWEYDPSNSTSAVGDYIDTFLSDYAQHQ